MTKAELEAAFKQRDDVFDVVHAWTKALDAAFSELEWNQAAPRSVA
jgi:hypothetical protein